MTTNKDIYTIHDKAIIVGTIPKDASDNYAVLIRVTGPGGDCATQNILPGADNSFVSRSIRLDECGLGEITVSAYYADQKATSTFTITNSSHADAGSKIELRMLKNIVLQAQETVNSRVKELVKGGYILPEEVVQEYSQGVSEASLALQAIEFGDAAEAKRHMILAFSNFRDVLAALSPENTTRFERTGSGSNSDIVGTYNMLQKYYYRLHELAEKNQVEKKEEFGAAALLLSNIGRMIDEGNYKGADSNLKRVNKILEKIRSNIIGKSNDEEKLASDSNSTSRANEELARKLEDFAARYEKKAFELLSKTGTNHDAESKVKQALSFIAEARISIDARNLESARSALLAAYKAINEAEELISDDEGQDDNTSNSGENPDDREESDNSGKNDDKDRGSGKDEDHQ